MKVELEAHTELSCSVVLSIMIKIISYGSRDSRQTPCSLLCSAILNWSLFDCLLSSDGDYVYLYVACGGPLGTQKCDMHLTSQAGGCSATAEP